MSHPTHHAVITGGSGMLGQAVATALAERGWLVHAPGSRELDVRRADTVRHYFCQRDVDLLVCAAGFVHDALLPRLDPEIWEETWSVNYLGARLCADAAIPVMKQRGAGHIVFVSSHSALHPPAGQAAYVAAKAALLGLTQDFAQLHGPSNIRVNAILPGFMESRITRSVTAQRREKILVSHALGRFNTADRVAAFIRFLHEELPHTSGQVFQLDSR